MPGSPHLSPRSGLAQSAVPGREQVPLCKGLGRQRQGRKTPHSLPSQSWPRKSVSSNTYSTEQTAPYLRPLPPD